MAATDDPFVCCCFQLPVVARCVSSLPPPSPSGLHAGCWADVSLLSVCVLVQSAVVVVLCVVVVFAYREALQHEVLWVWSGCGCASRLCLFRVFVSEYRVQSRFYGVFWCCVCPECVVWVWSFGVDSASGC